MLFRTCPYCGAHLDPAEKCDCLETQEAQEAEKKSQARREAQLAALHADLEKDKERKEREAAARRRIRIDQLLADLQRTIKTTAKTA